MNKFIPALLILIFFSCKAQQIPASEEAVIIMKKTPCFGSCPEYELMIFDSGQVVLNAKQHLNMEGKFVAQLSEESYKKLLSTFENSDFFSFEDQYTSNITDLPTTFLTFRHGGEEKRIKDYHGAPEGLKELEKTVHELINNLKWKKIKED